MNTEEFVMPDWALALMVTGGLVVAVVIVITIMVRRETRAIKHLARLLSPYSAKPLPNGIRLELDGYPAVLCWFENRRDLSGIRDLTNEGTGAWGTVIEIEFTTGCAIQIYPRTWETRIGEAVGVDYLSSGNPDFDQVFAIKATPPERALALLTPPILASLLELQPLAPLLELRPKVMQLRVEKAFRGHLEPLSEQGVLLLVEHVRIILAELRRTDQQSSATYR